MTLDSDVNLKHFADTCQHFTGADYKGKVTNSTHRVLIPLCINDKLVSLKCLKFFIAALLCNAQLAAVHEVTDDIRARDQNGEIPTPTTIDTFHFVHHDNQGKRF